MKIEIKNRFSGSLLFSIETDSWKLAVEAAYKAGAALRGAALRDADLRGAVLRGAVLSGADLRGADLRGEIKIERTPLQISGLYYYITIWDAHMQIGCEFHSLKEWESFDADQISEMDGTRGSKFWTKYKAALLALAKSDERE